MLRIFSAVAAGAVTAFLILSVPAPDPGVASASARDLSFAWNQDKLASFGVRHFETQEPADLECDPQLVVVAQWRDAQPRLGGPHRQRGEHSPAAFPPNPPE